MHSKETAKQVIDSLPGDASMDDIIHALYLNVKFVQGEKLIREGKGISQSDAKKKLGWTPKITFKELVAEMVREDYKGAQKDDLVKNHSYTVYSRNE